MIKRITQDMAYRQFLMKYAAKYGVSRASRKHNKSRSYIDFWKARWDGSVESLACRSRRPHSHPNQHTEVELKLIRDMRRRNPTLGMVELWHRLRQRDYTRRPESLFRVMRKLGMFPDKKQKKTYTDATTITKRMVGELIDHIDVYPAVKEDGVTNQRVTIHYNCIGAFEVPDRRKIPEQDILLETRKGAALSYAPAQIAI